MEMNSRESEDHHVIKIWEVNKDRLSLLQQKISEQPKLLRTSAALSSCCVFRVPRSFIDVNGKAYQPHIVSIGPYHHGQPHLQMFQEHKWRYLGSLISRTVEAKGLGLADYLKAIQPLESKARDCYSETIGLTVDEFVEMMVLDGCFVIELFRKVGKLVAVEADDPIFTMSWVFSFLSRDLLRIENQLPFFILQSLFDLSKIPGEEKSPSLATLALEFFNNSLQRPDEVLARYKNLDAKHLLDLLRSSFVPSSLEEPPLKNSSSSSTQVFHSVTKLRRAGITCKPAIEDTFLKIKFRHGVIEMPAITIDDFTSSFLQNCIAYEQCHRTCSQHVNTYATFMDCLINTPQDVGLLCDSKVMENYFGTDTEVAQFFNKLGRDVSFDIDSCYLSKLFDDVNGYYRNDWYVQWATFKNTYFNSPWTFISAVAAVVLLLLTISQTFFAAFDYLKPK